MPVQTSLVPRGKDLELGTTSGGELLFEMIRNIYLPP